jgi:phenylacetic acid degradation operon negative regulatory protein
LGLGAGATVFIARGLEPSRERQARALWDGEALTRGYRERAQALDAWREDSHRLPPEIAAREAYRLGNEAIHALVFDPLLPAPMVDTEARQAFVQSLQQFDAAGHAIWQKFLRTAREPAPTRSSLVEPTLETLS